MSAARAEITGADAGHSYLLDKLHSLSGIFPIGAFLAEHFWSNSYALVSEKAYDTTSLTLQTIPWRLAAETIFIFVPLLYHGVYGLYIWWKGQSNLLEHPWMSNWMYALQRWSGIVAFVFIGWHVYLERFLTGGKSTYATTAQAIQHGWYFWAYIIGVVATSFHFGNGIWNFCCKWGLAVTRPAQRGAAWLGAVVGIVFTVAGISIVMGFRLHWFPFSKYLP